MYELVPELLYENDIHLTKLPESIWIGVIEKMSIPLPVPRNRTKCYSKRPVYLYKGRRVFSVVINYKKNKLDFYYIPDEELLFIEKT